MVVAVGERGGGRARSVARLPARGDRPQDYQGDDVAWRDRFSPLYDPPVLAHYRSVADYTFAHGLVRTKVDADTLLDDRFVRQALKNLNLQGYWRNQASAAARSAAAAPAAANHSENMAARVTRLPVVERTYRAI